MDALYLPRVPELGQNSRLFSWASEDGVEQKYQLTSCKGGLSEKRNIVGTWDELTPWAAGRAGLLSAAAGARTMSMWSLGLQC